MTTGFQVFDDLVSVRVCCNDQYRREPSSLCNFNLFSGDLCDGVLNVASHVVGALPLHRGGYQRNGGIPLAVGSLCRGEVPILFWDSAVKFPYSLRP